MLNTNQRNEMELNLKEIIWDLLEQWKAVLIVALIMALLVTGAKFYKDNKAYNATIQEMEKTTQSDKTAEDRISEILESLSEEERTTVELMVNQNEWIETEKEYLNNSILMNTNPANQRTLMLDYYISMSDATESKMTALMHSYAGCLSDENLVKKAGQAIATEAETKYISELITISGSGMNLAINSDADGSVMEVSVVLPDDADAKAVENAMTTALTDYTSDLKSKIGEHSINLIKTSEAYLYNTVAANNKTNTLYAINNLQNNVKNMSNALSDGQKNAIDTIMAIKKEETDSTELKEVKDDAEVNKPTKPGLSKKYSLLGFVLGAMVYAFVYLILLIIKGRVGYASDAERYTHSRVLGEIYSRIDHKGLSKLIHSTLVDKYRYGNKADSESQITKTIDAVDAVCEHAGTREIAVFDMIGNSKDKVMSEILLKKAEEKGLSISVTEITKDMDERRMLSSPNALLLMSRDSKISDASSLINLCRDYDISIMGNVFIGTI